MRTVETRWGIGDTVSVDNNVTGTVVAILLASSGHVDSIQASYQVSWWHDGDCKLDWFYEWRVSA